jgi:Acyl-CoA dehydrogenase, C-terminal domain
MLRSPCRVRNQVAPYHEQWERDGCVSRVACTDAEAGFRGISLLMVELGEEGGGFVALMQNLPRERVAIGVTALAGAEKAFEDTLAYCQHRPAFGRPVGHRAVQPGGGPVRPAFRRPPRSRRRSDCNGPRRKVPR